MQYIIFDLEATCWDDDQPRVQEVIEIGAYKIAESGQVISSFSTFVRPVAQPLLSDFCKRLTSITQVDVNRAAVFPTAIQKFMDWVGVHKYEDYLLCSWGFFDRKILEKNCQQHNIEIDWLESHISLKHQYQSVLGLSKPIGLKAAVEREGFEFDGTLHRGIDDARNLAKIFLKFQDAWHY